MKKCTTLLTTAAVFGTFGTSNLVNAQDVVAPPAVAASKLASYGGLNFVSPDTEAFVSFYDIKGALEKLTKTGLGQFFSKVLEENEGISLAEALASPQAQQGMAFLGEELFLSFGKGTAKQTDGLVKLGGIVNELQFETLIQQMEQLTNEEIEDFDDDAWLMSMARHKDALLPILLAAEMPSIIIGMKMSDDNMRQATLMQAQGGLGFAMALNQGDEPIITTVRKDVGGASFSGIAVSGKALVQQQGMMLKGPVAEFFGAETADKIMKAAEKNSLTVMTGEKDGYVIAYIGKTPNELVLAESPAKSLAASDALSFAETYKDKDLLSVLYTSKPLMDTFVENRLVMDHYAKGLISGLQSTKFLGDTADLEALLSAVADAEAAMTDDITAERYGSVAFIEDGLKFENYGGGYYPEFGQTFETKFGAFEKQKDAALVFTGVTSKKRQKAVYDFLNLLGEAAYLFATKATKVKALQDEPDFKDFISGFSMFDQTFKTEALQVWKALSGDYSDGLGEQFAVVADLKGGFPALPDVPAAVVKDGRLPRIAIGYDVIDRTKVAASWKQIDTAAGSIVTKIGEMTGEKIPMMRPLSSEDSGLKSYFYALPFFTDGFTPAVSLNDKHLFLSTSNKYSAELAKGIAAAPVEKRKGMVAKVDFTQLHGLADHWVKLIEKDPKAILESDSAVEDFNANKEELQQILDVLKVLGSVDYYGRGEDNAYRGSIHLQAK